MIEVKVARYLSGEGDRPENHRYSIGGNFRLHRLGDDESDDLSGAELERLVTFITIGLIVLVAALNIVATLIMMVLEKTRDIAILMSMGATQRQYSPHFYSSGRDHRSRRHALRSGRSARSCAISRTNITSSAWPRRSTRLPMFPSKHPRWTRSIVAASAILISFLATLYPSAAAAKLQPVEACGMSERASSGQPP